MRKDETSFLLLGIICIVAAFLAAGCSSVTAGGGYIEDGWTAEVTALAPTNIGTRLSFSQEKLPVEWKEWGSSANRYAFGPLWHINVYKGFYAEPRLDIAYYPTLGTEFEPEFGLRLGYQHDNFGIYIGVRHPLGNGNRHEDAGRYSHIPDGWKPEAGAFITWGW